MKPLLMHPDRDVDLSRTAPNSAALCADLETDTLVDAMAAGDAFIADVVRAVLLAGLENDLATIRHRQAVWRDCLADPTVIRELYGLAVEAIDKERRRFGIFNRYPPGILHSAIDALEMFVGVLGRLRDTARAHVAQCTSDGLRQLSAMFERELGDAYLASVRAHLAELKFAGGMLMSAALGPGNQGTEYVLRQPKDPLRGPSLWATIFGERESPYTYRLAERDEAGARALSDLQSRGINPVANALAQSVDHILGFFQILRTELAFYIGCLNLHDRLRSLGAPVCIPDAAPVGDRTRRARGLYDPCLALQMGAAVVGNDLAADGKPLVIITGANKGGKSSFLRSVGLAQLMMHCGMVVAAEAFAAPLCSGLFTHYKREEDAAMRSGKLDEELRRMSEIADRISPGALVLFNESFAATNEREGSAIATQIVRALLAKRITVFFVSHLYELGHTFFTHARADTLFLRAERLADGTRTFKLVEGEPLATSYGEDLYRSIFGPGPADLTPAALPPVARELAAK
jgi:hypothetical protein